MPRGTHLLRVAFAVSTLATVAAVLPIAGSASAHADAGTVALSVPDAQVSYASTPETTNPSTAPENTAIPASAPPSPSSPR